MDRALGVVGRIADLLIASTAFIAASAPPCTLATELLTASIRSLFAADFAALMAHSLIHSIACLIASARRLPAVAPLTFADRETIDPSGRATGSLRSRQFHAGQAGIHAFDRGVRLVDVDLDDEFEFIVVAMGERTDVKPVKALQQTIVRCF